MNEFDVYKLYISLKLHFYSSYDIFKYKGKSKLITPDVFRKRNDKGMFKAVLRHHDIEGLMISNFLEKDCWIGEMKSEQGKKIYQDWKRRLNTLSYMFNEELKILNPDPISNFKTDGVNHPFILQLFLAKKISLETLLIVTELTGMREYLDKQLYDDFVWKEISLKLVKYSPFLTYPKEKFQKLLLGRFQPTNTDLNTPVENLNYVEHSLIRTNTENTQNDNQS